MVRPLPVFALLGAVLLPPLHAQTRTSPPDYRGVETHAAGIFVTPVPGAPFSATVEVISKQVLEGGEEHTTTTRAHIARDSAGRIYNERRAMATLPLNGDPELLSAHIYDPTTHLSTLLNASTHLAHQMTYVAPTSSTGQILELGRHDGGQLTEVLDLGEQTMGSTLLHGTRKVWTVSAVASGTGKPITITDEYWLAPALSIYLILKHEDPRTGEQIVAVQNVTQNEPDPATFQVPARYRIVDENPAP